MKHRKFWKILLMCLNIAWLGVIYYFSSQNADTSMSLSESLAQSILSIFGNFMSAYELDGILRQCAHFGIFMVEGFLLFSMLWFLLPHWKYTYLTAWGMCVLFAIADETHQLFSDGRAFELSDILLDSGGALLGSVCAVTILKILRHFIKQKCDSSSKS